MEQGGANKVALTCLISAGVLLTMVSSSSGQEVGGVSANVMFSQGLTYSDIDGTQGNTDFSFDLKSETLNQTFDLRLASELEQDLENGSSIETEEATAALSYGIENRHTAVTTGLSYRQADVDDFVIDSDGGPGIQVFDDGSREVFDVDLGLDFGREAKFGGSFDLGFARTEFSGTTNSELIDTERTLAALDLRFEIDPLITATLGYSWSETDRESGRDVESERFTLGGQYAVTPTLDAQLSLGFTRIEENDDGFMTVDDGLSFGFNVELDRPAGGLRFGVNSDLSESGQRTGVSVGGALETRRGDWDATFGLTESEDNKIRPTLALSYSEDLLRGSYTVSINQAFDTNTAGEETLNNRLRLTWEQDLTQSSRMASILTYQTTDVLGLDEDTSRFELAMSYSRELTNDWALTTRYTYSDSTDDTEESRQENEVFVGLETSFGWRP